MKNRNIVLFLFTAALIPILFVTTVYAVPVDTEVVQLYEVQDTFSFAKYLPAFVGASLVIEALLIILISDVKRIVTVSFASLVANAASFCIIRLLLGLKNHVVFYKGMLTHGPNLTTVALTALYFVITLAVELPIIWFSLRNFTEKTGRLLLAAGAANLVTTIATAVVELYLYQIHF